jgi:nicotinate-nucleotide adenylyltransferase
VGTQRIGWLGGSFDPVHDGHLAIARAAADALELDRVLLVPARNPPHKTDRVLAPAEDRLALLRLAVAGDPRLVPCDAELRREGLSYSYDTARELLATLPAGARLYYVIGADTLADLPHWHRIAELCGLVTFCAVAREGVALDAAPLLPLLGPDGVRRIEEHCLRLPPHPASSTAVRAALVAGERPEHLPPGVWDEIVRRGLYGAGGRSSRGSSRGLGRSKP